MLISNSIYEVAQQSSPTTQGHAKLKNSLPLVLAGVGILAALAKPASACEQTYAGFVSSSGWVTGSPPFHGSNTGNGTYTIVAPTTNNAFGCGFPVITFEPFGYNPGVAVGVLDFETCANGYCRFGVHFYNPATLRPVNSGWVFTVISTSNP